MDKLYKLMKPIKVLSLICILIVFLCPPKALSQSNKISGTVTDASSGETLPGVNVQVLGTTTGASTDSKGTYSLNVSSSTDTLQFSFIGYQAQRVPIGGRTQIDVGLQPQVISGEEMVVVGYGTQAKRDLTGSVSSVKSEEFNKGVNLSPQQLIQGRVAGVNISQNSGKPGGSNTIRIRGGTSITADNNPLYVVDGVPLQFSAAGKQNDIGGSGGKLMIFDQEPVNPLDSINPADIESIEILKDASAAAIYGSRGANGVIIITTKKGTPGKLSTTYDTHFSLSTVSKRLDVLNAEEYKGEIQNLGLSGLNDRGENTNWQDKIFRKAFSQNHNLSLSGGTEATQYRASLGYSSQEGVILSSGVDNYTGRINLNHQALEGDLTFDLNLTVAEIDEDNAPISNELTGEGGSLLKDALRFNPTFPIYEEDGSFAQINQFTINPVSYAKQIEDNRTTRRMLGNLSTTYDIFTPLSFTVNLGYTYENIGRNSYVPKANPLGEGLGGLANTQTSSHLSSLIETTLNYKQDISENQGIDAVAGYSYQSYVDQGNRTRVSGFISDEFKYNNIAAASNTETLNTFKQSNKLVSFYGRVNYSLLDRYLVTLTVRRDGSSRFGKDNKWGIFPSGSIAWRISDESFFQKADFVNNLKLRISYGITGNQEIGNYQSISTLGASSNSYVIGGSARTIVLPEQYANPDLKWEETSQLDIGVDFSFLQSAFYGNVDYYKKNTTDLLLSFAVPSPSVVGSQLANVGEVQNTGFEFTLGSNVIQNKDFSWKIDANLSTNKNEVVSLSNNQFNTDDIRTTALSGFGLSGVNSQIIIPGQPIGTFYGPKFVGIKNGKEQYADVNGDGEVSITEDEKVIGNARPDFTYGVSNSFFYKNWDLSFQLRGSVGNEVLNNTALDLQRLSILPGQNVLKAALDDGVDYGEQATYSSRWIEDASFLRLDNLTIGYKFNTSSISFLSNARLYATAQNLFVISGYSGYDPEVNSNTTGGGQAPLGIDYMSYPRSRTFILGASLSF